jgi:hypothetical protein
MRVVRSAGDPGAGVQMPAVLRSIIGMETYWLLTRVRVSYGDVGMGFDQSSSLKNDPIPRILMSMSFNVSLQGYAMRAG